MTALDDLRILSAGETVRARTDEGEAYVLGVADPVDYVEPDEYGAGHLEVPVEFDDDVDVPADEFSTGEGPGARGRVVARREDAASLGRPTLSVKSTRVEEHTGRRVERWEALGRVESVEVLDGDAGESE